MVDPISVVKGSAKVADWLFELSESRKMDKAIEESRRESIDYLMARAHEDDLRRAFEREHFPMLFRRLLTEAMNAITSDRRRLLVDAIAGAARHNDSAELQSRVARAVMQLEPSDYLLLRSMRRGLPSVESLEQAARDAQLVSRIDRETSRTALVAAQCVVRLPGEDLSKQLTMKDRIGRIPEGPPKFAITELGEAVLRYLDEK